MKFQRILIWVVAFTLAFFTGRTVIRNLWRLYYTPFQKALVTQAGWPIENSEPQTNYGIYFSKSKNTGRIGDYRFKWSYNQDYNRLYLSNLDSTNISFDGSYSVAISDNDRRIVLQGFNKKIVGQKRPKAKIWDEKINMGGIRTGYSLNQRIPWF